MSGYYANTLPTPEAQEREAERRAFIRECQDKAARIANDVQAVMTLAEEIALRWADDGLLNVTTEKRVFDADTHEWTVRRVPVSGATAAAFLAQCVRETMEDALNSIAREARDVAEV